MTEAVHRESIDWFLTNVPGATPEEIDEWTKNGEITVIEHDN